ncbi:hypothetical protein LXL04_030166 [Taraxacum kok-saghyz]
MKLKDVGVMVYISLMSTSMVFCHNNLLFSDQRSPNRKPLYFDSPVHVSGVGRRVIRRLIPNAKKKHKNKRIWWKKFFFDEDANWFGLKEDEMLEAEEEFGKDSSDDEEVLS